MLLLRRKPYNYVAKVFIGICLIALLWRVFLVYVIHVDSVYTYMASDARLDSLLWGCVLGLVFNPHLDNTELVRGRSGKTMALIIAIAVLLFCFLYRDEDFRGTARYSLQGIALWPIFWLAIRKHDWLVFRPLNWWVLRWLGRISYTLYLFHLTGYNLSAHLVGGGVPQIILGICISIAFSVAMYFLIEQRFAILRKRLHEEVVA
jgi:peptidoglycan/LPS O-acetylase OafA/YrhL